MPYEVVGPLQGEATKAYIYAKETAPRETPGKGDERGSESFTFKGIGQPATRILETMRRGAALSSMLNTLICVHDILLAVKDIRAHQRGTIELTSGCPD